jgi:formylglycine-generating enzyme required for sulfatase activity
MDTFEVTTGRFRVFVETSGGTQDNPPAKGAGMHPKIAGSGWLSEWNERLVRDRRELTATLTCGKQLHDPITWTDAPGPYESHPALCVTWYEAFAFCAWDGGRLPTDAEMNYAAAGGSEQRLHPWGNVPTTHSHAVVECRRPDCLPAVGSRPLGRGKWGHEDLIGSAQEWVLDIDDWPKVPCVDCAAVLDWSSRLTRGGSYDLIPQVQGYSAGSHSLPAVQRLGVGFRCARSP